MRETTKAVVRPGARGLTAGEAGRGDLWLCPQSGRGETEHLPEKMGEGLIRGEMGGVVMKRGQGLLGMGESPGGWWWGDATLDSRAEVGGVPMNS